jgi:hypothetical protein
MPYYRLYCFNSTNHIDGVHEIEAASDADAIHEGN